MGPVMTSELRAAGATFRQGDVKGARDQFQAALDNARKGGAGVAERGALLGLARMNACLGEKEAAAKTFEELWRVRTSAVGEADPGLFWDALEGGFTHTALGNTSEARQWFQKSVQVLDNAPEKLPWFERARLVPQWMMLRAGDTSLEAEVQEGMRTQKGQFRGPLVGFLKVKKKDMEICKWDRQIADVDAFAREAGFDQDPMWTSPGLPGEGGPPPAPAR